MEIQFGPNSVDEPNLLYKLQRKVKVFNSNNSLANRGYNLVASASKYGIVFVASPNGVLSAYNLKDLVDKECEPKHLSVKLKVEPTHISVNCEQEWLAVVGGQMLLVYKIADFQSQTVLPSASIKCDVNPGTYVSALQWNPCIPDTIGIVFFDGKLLVCQVSTMQVKTLQTKARCICWSPKGKQLVTGNSDGTLCQFKPDLSPMKTVPAPNLFESAPVEALAIHWISTYQFAVVFKNATNDSRPAVTIINTPKGGQPLCYNYEDICYSMGSSRPWFYYLQGIAQWNLILSSSSNSMEIATLGAGPDGASWFQWCQPDEGRPELPLTDKKQENYPVGIAIDTCAIHQLPWGENDMLPTMPMLHVVSQTGLLSIFNIINLNKSAPQICAPPQPSILPAGAMISDIPDDVPAQPAAPSPTVLVIPKPQIQQVTQLPQAPIQAPQASSPSLFGQVNSQPKTFGLTPSQPNFGFSAAPPITPAVVEQKQVEPKPVVAIEPQPQAQPKPPAPAPAPTAAPVHAQSPSQTEEVNAALKSEQEKANRAKANKELKDMLVREVNDFQMELYKFMLKTRETQTKLQRDIETINANVNLQSLDTEQLRKECSMDELRESIIQLKLELVRACAVVAEARTHAETKDLHQWAQADPLTAKRVASVKKLAYYVQSQLDQAHKALDHKWNEMATRDQDKKFGRRMIRPVLDDVYQPLVKQQEILSRQQAVLKTLKNTLKDCDVGPVFKSTSILRSTPFKKDPLSKLTKNILNMNIETNDKAKETILTSQKLDALRDMLSNHKPTKVKPVNVELRQQLAAIHRNYTKIMKEKADSQKNGLQINNEHNLKTNIQPTPVVKLEPKPDIMKASPPAVFTPPISDIKPKTGLTNVARTLFTNDSEEQPMQQLTKPTQPMPMFKSEPIFSVPTTSATTITPNTKSLLKDLLQSKSQASTGNEVKSESNTFMGQNICSPNVFNFTKTPTATSPSTIFGSKPAPNVNLFNKFQQPPAQPEIKPSAIVTSPKSDETGESQTAPQSLDGRPKEDKPMTNLFGLKPLTSPNVPDVLKTNTKTFNFGKIDPSKITIKLVDKDTKENIPEKSSDPQHTPLSIVDSENGVKPFSFNFSNKPPAGISAAQPVIVVDLKKSSDGKAVLPDASKSGDKLASSIFSSANANTSPITSKPQATPLTPNQGSIIFGTSATTPAVKPSTPNEKTATTDTTNTTESASPTELKTATPSGSMFTTTVTTASLFGNTSSQGSLFSAAITTTSSSIFGTATAQSVFASASAKPSVFSSPTTTAASSVTETAPTQASTEKSSQPSFVTSTPSSVFASANLSAFRPSDTTQSSLFTSSTASTTTTQSIFGTATTATSVFGSTPTSSQSVFNVPVSKTTFAPASTTQSIFGTATATTQSSIFGTATTSQSSVFGSSAEANQKSVFGVAQASTPASVFGSSTTSSTQASVFGTTPSESTAQASVFGAPSATQASIFGTTTPTTQASVFGAATTQASVFGSSSPGSVFGSSTATSQAAVFGATTPTTQASVFGTPPQTTPSSVFGSTTPTTQASIFGTPTTTQTSSLFGGAESNLFAAASISTTNASNQNGGIFGASSTSVFGSNTGNVFGGKSTFGQANATAASIFGGGASFGQKPANDFWSGASSGFGQPSTQASSIFGGTTGGSFSAPSTGQPFGSPQQTPPSFGGGDNTQSVFGSNQQQTAPAFGGSPGFGSKPVFGQTTGFGSPSGGAGFGSFGGFNKSPSSGFGGAATFGGGATFGGPAFGSTSPAKVFGGSSPTGFGSPTQANATFENLASQNTLTFGNLAQQSGQPPAPSPPSFNASPSFTGWRG